MKFLQRKRIRMKWYNYSLAGTYFVTICTQDRIHCFGDVVNGKMLLNELGKYATEHWLHISDHYPFVDCHDFVCMPNHIHGVIVIGENNVGTQFLASDDKNDNAPDDKNGHVFNDNDNGNLSDDNKNNHIERTYKNTSLQSSIPKSWLLGAIIRGYKIWITKYANQHNIPFARQWRFHDHIIRDQQSYDHIANYIHNNPQKRTQDRLYK